MSSGIKGTSSPGGGPPTLGTTALVSATATTTLILSVCNRTSAADTIRVAVVPSGTATSGAIADEYYIEYDFSLNANTSFERTGITLESGARLIVGSGNGSCSFVAYGLEA